MSSSLAVHKSWIRVDKWIISRGNSLKISSVFSIPSFPKCGKGCFVYGFFKVMLSLYLYHLFRMHLTNRDQKIEYKGPDKQISDYR